MSVIFSPFLILLDKENLTELRARLSKRRSPDIIVIDSVQYLKKFYTQTFGDLKDDFPDKLFIFISQADKAGKDPATPQLVRIARLAASSSPSTVQRV